MKKYSVILWDWNGTLLDDVWLCVDVMNTMLAERNLPLISRDRYRSIFDFPVKDYYEKLGFDFTVESFEIVGMEFMNRYNKRQFETSLHEGVVDMLSSFKSEGYRQFILSAREEKDLKEEIRQLRLDNIFEKVYGLDDHYAHGKTDVGIKFLRETGIDPASVVFIGDTSHDAEVASEIGVDCLLIPNGHHSIERLILCNAGMVPSLDELIKVL
jgi:phosphoglycolate phosphatase